MNDRWRELDARKRAHDEQQDLQVHTALRSGEFPTPDDIVAIIKLRVGRNRQALMRSHAFWKEHQLRTGFDALVAAALSAHVDLCRCDAALTAFASRRENFQTHVQHTVENPAQKEVMAFCAALMGTVDTLRRIKKTRSDLAEEIDLIRIATMPDPEIQFILDLRKNLSHGSVVVPGWSTSSDFKITTGSMKFNVDELLAFGDWSAPAKAFLVAAPDGAVTIAKTVSTCAERLVKFQRELKALFRRNPTDAENDFHWIEDSTRKMLFQQFIKIALQSLLKKPGDPYRLLPYLFDDEEVREIMRRPKHSVEQVELMIALKSAKSDCDADLRSKLYEFFGVSPTPS